MSSQSISFKPTTVIRQLPWSIDLKTTVRLLIILSAISLIGWLYLGQASGITTSTLKIEKLNREVTLTNQQNAQLALQIAESGSLEHIKQRATDLGYAPTDPANIRYLTINEFPPVVNTANTSAGFSTPSSQQSAEKTWFDNLIDWISGYSG